MKRLIIIICLVAELYGDNFQALCRATLENNPLYQSSLKQIAIEEQKEVQAFAFLLPSVVFNAYDNYFVKSNIEYKDRATNAVNPYNTMGTDIKVTQPLYQKQHYALYSQSKLYKEYAKIEVKKRAKTLVDELIDAYTQALKGQNEKESAYAKKELYAHYLTEIEKRLSLGEATVLDLNEMKGNFYSVEGEYEEANNLYRSALATLFRLTKVQINRLDPLSFQEKLYTKEYYENKSLLYNPEIQLQQMGQVFAKMQIDIGKAGHYPTVELNGNYSRYSTQGGINGAYKANQGYVGISLALPLFQGGATHSKIEEASLRYQQTFFDLQSTIDNVYEKITSYRLSLETLNNKKKIYNFLEESSQLALDAALRAYSVKAVGYSEVLRAKEKILRTKKERENIAIEYATTSLKLINETGELMIK